MADAEGSGPGGTAFASTAFASTAVAGAPGRLPAAERREQLLSVAVGFFGARGFHGTSMDAIAEAAGVTKPVVYQHFASKHSMYLQLIEQVGDELVAALTAALVGETPHEQVTNGFRGYFRFVRAHTTAWQLLFGGGTRPSNEASEAVRRVEARIADVLAELIEADIDAEHRRILGFGIVGLAEVSSRLWVDGAATAAAGATPDLEPAEGERFATHLADLAWAGLRGLPRATR